MFDQKVRVVTEGLARAMGRRKFVTQVSAAIFAGMATLAAGRLGETVFAQQKDGGYDPSHDPRRGRPDSPFATQCFAPNGRFCSINDPQVSDGCQGAYCFQHLYNGQLLECKLSYNYGYAVGCWTTTVSTGYWTCCDCDCGSPINPAAACGCARFSTLITPSSS